jgi:hypothetical protein
MPAMSETMTVAEMEERFPNHWLLIADPVSDEFNRTISGRVIFASEDRDERDAFIYGQDPTKDRPKRTASLCTGKVPPGMVMIPSIFAVTPREVSASNLDFRAGLITLN